VPTEQLAVAVANEAWRDKFSADHVRDWEPYQGELIDGAWHIYGTLPGGARGGTPEALVCASDGKVLRVFHTQ